MKSLLRTMAPAWAAKWIYRFALNKPYSPAIGKIRPGDFFRETPFCSSFGDKRGGALDRHYIEGFLEREAGSIRGRVLEIGDNAYTRAYGGENVTRSDILHVDDSNPRATFIADLSDAPDVPSEAFDCLILTQTLHLVFDMRAALATCHRILKPGGTLLLTVPGITQVDQRRWRETWYWSLTVQSLRRLLAEEFSEGAVEVESFGNVYVAAAFLYGMGRPEVSRRELARNDPRYPVIVTGKAVKGARADLEEEA